MEESRPLCSSCNAKEAEIVIYPAEGRSAQGRTDILCSNCFSRFPASLILDRRAIPYQFITTGPDGRYTCVDVEFDTKSDELLREKYEYHENMKRDKEAATALYHGKFEELLELLRQKQAKIMGDIEESFAVELEHTNVTIFALKTAKDSRSLEPSSAYLVSEYNSFEQVQHPPYITLPNLDELWNLSDIIPNPKITMRNKQLHGNSANPGLGRLAAVVPISLIEDSAFIFPIDTRNILKTTVGGAQPERQIISCPNFPYRVDARWCKVTDGLYIYTGGLYRDLPCSWTDFIQLIDPLAEKFQGKNMRIPRHRHAMISHQRSVYVFGGSMSNCHTDETAKSIEMLTYEGSWATSNWEMAGEFPEAVFDLTATVHKDMIYLAGKSNNIYTFNTINSDLGKISIRSIIDVPAPENQIEPLGDVRQVLPRKASNSLIFSWQSHILVLQHDHVYWFVVGADSPNLFRGEISCSKSWCSPFPAIVQESKVYFIQEQMEQDLSQAELWSFDFVKKDVALVSFEKKKSG